MSTSRMETMLGWPRRRAGHRSSAWSPQLRAAAIFTLAGSAVIHLSQVETHLAEWGPAGITFIVLAAVELALAALVALAPSRPVFLVGILTSWATIVLWATSRTVGIPFGPEAFTPEAVGRPDLIATVEEAITAMALLALALQTGIDHQVAGPKKTALGVGVLAVAIAGTTWFGVTPQGGCQAHHGSSQALTGPLVPIDGHSMLSRTTPIIEAGAGQELGLVVGMLHNCGSSPLTVRSARLIGTRNFNRSAQPGSFWVLPGRLMRPGHPIALRVLQQGTRLPGTAEVPPADGPQDSLVLVLTVRARVPGQFLVTAVEISYQAGDRAHVSPYASVAWLVVR